MTRIASYSILPILLGLVAIFPRTQLTGTSASATPETSTSTPTPPLLKYQNSDLDYEFLYPSELFHQEWDPTLDILSSVGFYLASIQNTSGEGGEIPEIAVTVFANPHRMNVIDWANLHTNPDFNNLPASLDNSAALFEDAGIMQTLTVDGLQAVLFPQISGGLTIGRLLIEHEVGIVSIAYADFGGGEMKDAFATIVATFNVSPFADIPSMDMLLKETIANTISSYDSPSPQANLKLEGGVTLAATGYKLPWMNGVSHFVTQGWGGSYSHQCPGQMCYAYDFDLPEGEEVRASRGGTVSDATGHFTACGGLDLRNSANRVTIDHDDGSATLYLHLDRVDVAQGNLVNQGNRIGASGKTGWTNCDPHLHFQRQGQGIWITDSLPVYFDEYPGAHLVVASPYTSQNGGAVGEDTTPPSGHFTSPSDGSTISSRTVTISVNASDNAGGSGVKEVRFSAVWPGGAWTGIGTDSSEPYSIEWDMCNSNVPDGDVELGMEISDNAGNIFIWSRDGGTNPHITKNYACAGGGDPLPGDYWDAEAWQNKYLAGYPNWEGSWIWDGGNYPYVSFDWGTGAPFGWGGDEFSMRLWRNVYFPGGSYSFHTDHDDGVRVYIDGSLIIDAWWDGRGRHDASRNISAGDHEVKIEYYENLGDAVLGVWWYGPSYPRPDNNPPDGHITSPENGSYMSSSTLTIAAQAWDDASGVERVEFFAWLCDATCDWRLLGTDYIEPYQKAWDWSSRGDGQFTLRIDVYDNTGKALVAGLWSDSTATNPPPASTIHWTMPI